MPICHYDYDTKETIDQFGKKYQFPLSGYAMDENNRIYHRTEIECGVWSLEYTSSSIMLEDVKSRTRLRPLRSIFDGSFMEAMGFLRHTADRLLYSHFDDIEIDREIMTDLSKAKNISIVYYPIAFRPHGTDSLSYIESRCNTDEYILQLLVEINTETKQTTIYICNREGR